MIEKAPDFTPDTQVRVFSTVSVRALYSSVNVPRAHPRAFAPSVTSKTPDCSENRLSPNVNVPVVVIASVAAPAPSPESRWATRKNPIPTAKAARTASSGTSHRRVADLSRGLTVLSTLVPIKTTLFGLYCQRPPPPHTRPEAKVSGFRRHGTLKAPPPRALRGIYHMRVSATASDHPGRGPFPCPQPV